MTVNISAQKLVVFKYDFAEKCRPILVSNMMVFCLCLFINLNLYMDLYYGSLQFHAHLEEMRMVCNTHAPPQLQGMEYPSPGRTVQRPHPREGDCQS